MRSRTFIYIDNNSPGLKDTLLRDCMFRRYNPEDAAPEDTDEAQRLLCKLPYKYKTGDSVMIRSEEEVHRWLLVKIVQSYGWWVLGGYIPIYVISFGNGALQNCQEDEIWPVHQILNMRKTRVGSPTNNNRKYSRRPSSHWDDDEALEVELARKLKQWKEFTGRFRNSSDSDAPKSEGCSCVGEQCVHSNGGASLEDGEIIEEWESEVF